MSIEMSVEIRVAEQGDAVSACSVLRRSISECCMEDHRNDCAILSTWLGNKTPENVAAWFASPANFSVVAVDGGKVVGVAVLTRDGRIVLFYVDPGARFCGIGKSLLQALESQAREWKLRSLRVISTLAAQHFYARNGFIAAGIAKTAFGTEGVSFSKALDGSPKRKGCRCSSDPSPSPASS